MGAKKYQERINGLFRKSPVVDFASVKRIVGSEAYAKLLIANALRHGRIKRLGRGVYTLHDEIGLSVFAFQPGYLGLQSALSQHSLWEQETVPIILTARKTRIGTREVMGCNVTVRRIAAKYLFGIAILQDGQFFLPYSDVEKTIIDMVAYRQHVGTEVIRTAKKKVDQKKMERYLRHYPQALQRKVRDLLMIRL